MIIGKLGAVGARTARACDGCLKTRARWYCSADDAFLCQACDTSVHSANQLASRHERIRLRTSSVSFKPSPDVNNGDLANPPADNYESMPVWYKGVTRKARTLRGKNTSGGNKNNRVFSARVVPHIRNEDENEDFEEGDEQLMCRVPVFDPFDDPIILCQNEIHDSVGDDFDVVLPRGLDDLSLEVDLAKFAAEVESMLETSDGKASGSVNDVSLGVNGMELMLDCESEGNEEVKIECYDSLFNQKEDGEEDKKMLLRLDYDAVLTACLIQGCNYPWSSGILPQELDFDDDGWTNFLGKEERTLSNVLHRRPYGEVAWVRGFPRGDSEGRELRVLRYKEKRRTRLFSKKIRYEVRKLNAEKRPRMKGRFVKRSTSSSFTQCLPLPYFRS